MENIKKRRQKSIYSLRYSLLLWFLLISLLPLVLVSWFGYQQASNSLIEAAENRLIQSSSLSLNHIKDWFKYRFADLKIQAESQKNIKLLQFLEEGLKNSGLGPDEYVDTYEIDDKGSDLVLLRKNYDYISDIYLIDRKGNVLFSVAKRTDLGANLFSSAHVDTLFSKSVMEVFRSGGYVFSDLQHYGPFSNEVVGFLTAPVLNKSGKVLGAISIKINIDYVFYVLKSNEVGGVEQVFYLVGEDGLLRTAIKGKNQERLRRVISTRQMTLWQQHDDVVQGNEHTQASRYMGPDGVEVIGIHHELNLPGVNWILISEVNSSEALNAAYVIAKAMIVLIIVTVLIVFTLAVYLSGRITKPVIQLANASRKIAAGDQGVHFDVSVKNEIGELAEAFKCMLKMQKKSDDKLQSSLIQVENSYNALNEQKSAFDQHSIVAITDVKGNIEFVNKKFSEISGYSETELIGKNHRLLKSGFHSDDFFKKMYKTIASGKVWNDEICNKTKKGDIYWVDTTIVPFMGKNSKPERYIAIRTDITARKRTEVELIEAKNIAESAVLAKGQFLASMSHEIRTPMNGVLGMLSLLQNTDLNDEQKHRLNVAQSSAKSLLGLINDILDYSKVDAGKLELEILDFDLRHMLGEFLEAMAYQAEEKNLELILDEKNIEYSRVKGDPGRLRQVLTNLVSNAIKFTTKGEIIIRLSVSDKNNKSLKLSCSVSDTGVGIAESKLDKLFDSFSQVDASTTRKYGGTGLGLAIAKKLCGLMGGDISVNSEENKGSCFEFYVLLGKSEQSQLVMPEASISNLKILIVDDNATNREVLRCQIEKWGAEVVDAESGAEALEICERCVQQKKMLFDIALLDMQMPEMDGVELSRKLQQDERFSEIKLVMMTSMGHQGDAQFFSDLGFSAYFPKPATTSDLFDALAVVADDGEVLHLAKPLLTSHYLGTLKRSESSQKMQCHKIIWPDKCRLLLVEDNHVNQLVATGILNKMGLQTDISGNGCEAVHSLQHAPQDAPYTLILMDCQMPEMDGYEATAAIRSGRAGERNKEIIIIAMTANAMAGDREKCLNAGMNDYITKPVDADKLQEKLTQWVNVNYEKVDNDSVNEEAEYYSAASEAKSDINKIWDEHEVLSRVMGNKDLLLTMMGVFSNETPLRMEQLKKALERNDLKQVQSIMHTFKGVAANLSAQSLCYQAGNIEKAAKSSLNQEVSVLMPDFEVSVRKVIDCFQAYLALSKSSVSGDIYELDNECLGEKLYDLASKLKNCDYIDAEEIEPLRHASNDVAIQALLNQLCEQIMQFDNEAALNSINEITGKSGINMPTEQEGE
ncbi:sensory box histidine kinase/response regulator [hydrothermal vent metagenome]|uniref:histidine kinase n=1 Tax=hydrothermal vent metagenome TaxID=652676 RepID=A0A3B0XLY8_9ZZZZ